MKIRWLAALALALAFGTAAHAAELTVSAAASLSDALRELAPRFEAQQPGTTLRLNFGASGALLQQIARGAPADVLASADEATMDEAAAAKLLRAGTRRDFAANTLVLVVPASTRASTRASTPASMPASARPIPRALTDLPALQRIAIGQPASVPAGRYARAALEAAGLWAAVEPRTIGASTVRQALDYVARDEVDAAFVYATDAALMPGKVRVAFTVPTPQPIRYPVAALEASTQPGVAQAFVQFLLSQEARSVLAKYGFSLP